MKVHYIFASKHFQLSIIFFEIKNLKNTTSNIIQNNVTILVYIFSVNWMHIQYRCFLNLYFTQGSSYLGISGILKDCNLHTIPRIITHIEVMHLCTKVIQRIQFQCNASLPSPSQYHCIFNITLKIQIIKKSIFIQNHTIYNHTLLDFKLNMSAEMKAKHLDKCTLHLVNNSGSGLILLIHV